MNYSIEEGKPPADDLKIACGGQNGLGDREREDWKGERLINFLLQFIQCKIRMLHTCKMGKFKGPVSGKVTSWKMLSFLQLLLTAQ